MWAARGLASDAWLLSKLSGGKLKHIVSSSYLYSMKGSSFVACKGQIWRPNTLSVVLLKKG